MKAYMPGAKRDELKTSKAAGMKSGGFGSASIVRFPPCVNFICKESSSVGSLAYICKRL